MKRLAILGLGLTLLATSALGAGKVKPKPAPPPPTYAGSYQPQGVDEIGLWREDDEGERALANSPLVIRDEKLTAYVRGILCATVGTDRCNSVRTYILRVPVFNASMSPNGTMRIYSGLLLRARSEAELASVLGHEFGHFEGRHTLERFKAARTGTDLLSWAALLASMSNSPNAQRNFQSLEVSVYGRLARFGRDHEREADLLSIGYLNASKLRPHSASRIWRNLILEAEASALARGYNKPDFNKIAFFASHPADGERANYLYALAEPDTEGRDDGAERYAAALAPWLPLFLDDQVALNDFGASEFIINRLAESGWTADLWRARGDLFRARGNQRDLMNAADFYGKSVALDASSALAYRGLGLSLIKTGRISEGKAALKQYLSLLPEASDASMINTTLSTLGEQ
jgi:beta-barrel assembly-enhancing protease